MTVRSDDRRHAVAVWTFGAVALALAIMFRFWNLLETPLWLDEAYSRFAADHDFTFLWTMVPRYETHPPFYYSLLHLWCLVAGDSLPALRAPGLLFGAGATLLSGLGAAALADRLGADAQARRVMVVFAAAFVALHPVVLQMDRQARPYSLMILVYALVTLALLRLEIAAQHQRPLPRRWIATFFAAQALMLWLHSLGPLYAASMTAGLAVVMLFRGCGRRDWLWLAGGQLVAAVAYVPAFLILLRQAPTWVHSTWLVFDPASLPADLCMLFAGSAPVAMLLCAVALAVGLAVLLRVAGAWRAAAALLLMAFAPLSLSILVSAWVSPVFLVRTLTPILVPFALLVAAAACVPSYRLVIALLMAIQPFLFAAIDRSLLTQPSGENWYAASDWLYPRFRPGEVVWTYPNEGALPLAYALEDRGRRLPVRPIPAAVPALGVKGAHPTGTPGVVAMDDRQIAALLSQPRSSGPCTIWLVGLAAERLDPQRKLLHALERSRVETARYRVNEIEIIGLRRADAGRGCPAGELPPVAAPQQP